MLTEEKLKEALSKVHDPELRIDIITLELVYDMKILENNKAWIKMTFTTPGCPYGPALLEAVKEACTEAGASDCEIELTFDPPWQPSEDVKWAMGAFSPWSH